MVRSYQFTVAIGTTCLPLQRPEKEFDMDDWFTALSARTSLSACQVRDLHKTGFIIVPGPIPASEMPNFAAAYDEAVSSAAAADVAIGGSTTRVSDFVNRSPIFDAVYLHEPVLEACCRVIEQPFKLSTMLARTLRPRTAAQELHVDFASNAQGWPMVGFILMIDGFRRENGATCFIPGSQGVQNAPTAGLVPALGPAGSLIIFNGSVWHGHGTNETHQPRRSLQGAFIRRTENSGGNLPARMRAETLTRLTPLAKYLLELQPYSHRCQEPARARRRL